MIINWATYNIFATNIIRLITDFGMNATEVMPGLLLDLPPEVLLGIIKYLGKYDSSYILRRIAVKLSAPICKNFLVPAENNCDPYENIKQLLNK